ncbi:MAG: hypothetical protein JKY93_00425 [Gammaproteobacteria bacterium]|nr:hypothetical protein [Gammaproteobacteria bacterium]MBL4898011.1 hypothetical protein [Colwellia sp.]
MKMIIMMMLCALSFQVIAVDIKVQIKAVEEEDKLQSEKYRLKIKKMHSDFDRSIKAAKARQKTAVDWAKTKEVKRKKSVALRIENIKSGKSNSLKKKPTEMSKVDRAIKEMGIDLNSETYSDDLLDWADKQLGID